jgi:sugar-specific transcriptional regulator TrmB
MSAYEPKPGSRTAAVLAYLRDRKAPATASEIAAGAGVPRSYVGGLAQHLISKAAVRRIEGRPVRYEALQ